MRSRGRVGHAPCPRCAPLRANAVKNGLARSARADSRRISLKALATIFPPLSRPRLVAAQEGDS
eukprot:147142-Pyramimonas_sp.AAC.1